MSAPSLFDRFVTREARTPAATQVLDPCPVAQERRSRRPADVLSRQHEALCRNATDPLEIAAGLEAAGLSDRRVRATYGVATVFELAEDLYHRVPRRPEAADLPDPWRRPRRELFARGFVYALPGLLLAGAVQHLTQNEALVLLMVSVVASAANQALAHVGHVLLGRRQLTGTSTLLRHALIGSVLAGTEIAALALWADVAGWAGAVVALLAVVYLTSATVVLLLDRHEVLLALLGPAAALGLLALVPGVPLSQPLALSAAVLSLVGSVAAAWVLATRLAGPQGPAPRIPLQPGDVRSSLPLFAHGALSMTLLAAIPYAALHGSSGVPQAIGPVMLPAVLSLGAAEVHLYGFRRRAGTLLDGAHVRHFASTVRVHLTRRVLTYMLLLLVLTQGVLLFADDALATDPDSRTHLATYLLLAVALFVASLLISTSHVRTVALLEAGALTLDVLLQKAPTGALAMTAAEANLVAAALLAMAMFVLGSVQLGRVVSHR